VALPDGRGAGGAGRGASAPLGLTGMGASAVRFLRGIVAARGVNRSRDEFREYWRTHVLELSLLVHQYRGGAPVRARLEQVRVHVCECPCVLVRVCSCVGSWCAGDRAFVRGHACACMCS
jgi:hypothetical protein